MRNPLPTLIHELYHIGEGFDGKMRPVRHGPGFDREVRRLTRNWLEVAKGKLPRLAEMRMDELKQEFGTVLAESVPNRFVFPLVERVEPPESYEQGVERLYPGYRLATSYEVRPTRVTGAGSPRHLSEKELVLRLYDRDGTQRVPAVFARYGRRHLTRGS